MKFILATGLLRENQEWYKFYNKTDKEFKKLAKLRVTGFQLYVVNYNGQIRPSLSFTNKEYDNVVGDLITVSDVTYKNLVSSDKLNKVHIIKGVKYKNFKIDVHIISSKLPISVLATKIITGDWVKYRVLNNIKKFQLV